MLGVPLTVATTIVVAFIFFGQLLFKSGGSEFFTDISLALMGRYRGGSAKIAITASGLFGSISGSAVSNVVATGVITIPLMRQGGYPAHLAGAIEAVASTGGQLMPPVMGAAAFLMAEFLQIPYRDVVVAALLPAILYYVGLFITADLEAAKHGISRVEESRIPAIAGVLRSGWHFPIPFAVLILALFTYNRTPEESALLSACVLVVFGLAIGYRGKRMRPMAIVEALRDTGHASLEILTIAAAAGFVIGVLSISGLGFGLTIILVQIGSGNLVVLLLLAAVTCIILGCGMPTAAVYVLLAALVAPALIEVGLQPIAAHLYVLFFGMMSMITPPVAIAAFAAASLAGADAMKTGFAAMRFGWTAFVVPFLFIASPSLLLQGDPEKVIWAVITAIAGVWLACIGVVGYLTRPLNPLQRAGAIAAGLMMLVPAGAFEGALATDIGGIVLAVAIVGWELMRKRGLLRAPGTAE
jgi:TRAP transporter 4TM/12TM fusion protein